MRILWLLIVLLFNFQPKHERLVILEKTITVSGTTSLGKFECNYNVDGLKDTLIFENNTSSTSFLFDIPVNEFACGNFLLNNDFRKTIKAKQYPKAQVKVKRLRRGKSLYVCDLYLEIAGKKSTFRDFELTQMDNRLLGNLLLSFDALELEAPSKFGGLVKVDEVLSLSLSLTYQ